MTRLSTTSTTLWKDIHPGMLLQFLALKVPSLVLGGSVMSDTPFIDIAEERILQCGGQDV